MAEFIFPQGMVWVLDDGNELGAVGLEGGGVALLLFSDGDLAASYAEANGMVGKEVKGLKGGAALAGFLDGFRKLGATHVLIDHTPGRITHTATIDEVIANARQQAG
jgi:hypothetical protein